jgi:APA family basic amino acid/polyamine antiporter
VKGEGNTDRSYGVGTATLLVIASMIGTGVFTTSGPLLETVGSPASVLLVWLVGGLVSLCGALSYAEIGSAHPVAGGEYTLLGRAIHPALGFAAGVVSVTAGFAAPIAVCSIAFASYLRAAGLALPETPVALALVLVATALHLPGRELGARAQNALTALKIALAVGLALVCAPAIELGHLAGGSVMSEVSRPSFGLGVIEVFFAYTGWNAAVYVAGDLTDPVRTLPRALVLGTVLVTLVYLLLNAVFVLSVPIELVRGHVAIAERVLDALAGPTVARALSALIAFGLVSTVGAFVLSGARVYQAIARDHARLTFLGRTNAAGAPIVALGVQAAIAAGLVLVGTLRDLLGGVGMALSITSALTVLSIFVERRRRRPVFSTPGYPLVPLLYLLLIGWVVVGGAIERPDLFAISVGTLAIGGVGFAVLRRKHERSLLA